MKRYGSEICVALLLAVVISCFGGVIVYASSAENQITDQMELTDLQSMVDEMLGEKTFSVTEAFHRLLSGEEVLSEESVREFLHSLLFYGIEREKELIVKLLLLLLFAAVFSGFHFSRHSSEPFPPSHSPLLKEFPDPFKLIIHQDIVEQHEKGRQQGAYQKHAHPRSSSYQMSQISDGGHRRNVV